jgi:hypothetical protein
MCNDCIEAWAPCAADGSAVGLPAGAETRNARATLRERQVERLVAEALRDSPNGRYVAEERVASFLAYALRLPTAEQRSSASTSKWCREAWRALHGASYADFVRHAQTYRPRRAD